MDAERDEADLRKVGGGPGYYRTGPTSVLRSSRISFKIILSALPLGRRQKCLLIALSRREDDSRVVLPTARMSARPHGKARLVSLSAVRMCERSKKTDPVPGRLPDTAHAQSTTVTLTARAFSDADAACAL